MKVILQRVKEARVTVEGEVVGAIENGLLLLVGMAAGDAEAVMRLMAGKIANLRIFEDDQGKMNLSILDTGGSALAVSQFTLFADCRKGRRPSFTGAAPAEEARASFNQFVSILRETGLTVETGKFQAMMDVSLVNAGPVTIVLDSNEL